MSRDSGSFRDPSGYVFQHQGRIFRAVDRAAAELLRGLDSAGHLARWIQEGLVVGIRSLPGNPYDGHTLPEAIEQVSILTNQTPKAVFVDKGYRGASVDGVTIWRSGQRRGVTPSIRKAIHRRSAIEPAIGHMKNEGKLRRNWLKGSLGDALNAVLCGAGHNLRMILRALRHFYARSLCFWIMLINQRNSQKSKFNYLIVW